ncbi:MAG: hypothetical protein FJZ00_01225 [Candidatus Sericytochromatia bacterium]|uniref:Uncharacterized protein n=1 Tax=Candidatus Tanganyikabacteria bacterium TaxID=2961651 RepID=A0A937X3N5_9BACT|nr:hypothetical protein [Candidatus Tanganyikabacteria bacterium]
MGGTGLAGTEETVADFGVMTINGVKNYIGAVQAPYMTSGDAADYVAGVINSNDQNSVTASVDQGKLVLKSKDGTSGIFVGDTSMTTTHFGARKIDLGIVDGSYGSSVTGSKAITSDLFADGFANSYSSTAGPTVAPAGTSGGSAPSSGSTTASEPSSTSTTTSTASSTTATTSSTAATTSSTAATTSSTATTTTSSVAAPVSTTKNYTFKKGKDQVSLSVDTATGSVTWDSDGKKEKYQGAKFQNGQITWSDKKGKVHSLNLKKLTLTDEKETVSIA